MSREPHKVTKEQYERIADYVATFSTPAGQRVLEDLENEYDYDRCYTKDLHETLRRTAERDVLDYIRNIVSQAEMGLEIEEEKEGEE